MKRMIAMLLMLGLLWIQGQVGFAQNNEEALIVVYSDESYPPYEYVREGQAEGFNVDILKAVGKATGLKFEFRTGKWEQLRAGVENGKVELLSGMFYSKERAKLVEFSEPFVYVDYTMFVRKGTLFQNEKDLMGKAIIVQKGDIMEDYAIDNYLTQSDKFIRVENPLKSLQLLAKGKGDVVLIGRMQGHYFKFLHHLDNIEDLEINLVQKPYCFAMKKGNTALKNKLDVGLKIIKEDGTYDQIYKKWFKTYQKMVTFEDILWYGLVIFVPLAAILIGYSLWIYLLKIEVSKKTKALNQSQRSLNQLNMQLEEMIQERTRELEDTIKELQLMQSQLIESEKMSALGTLVAGVTHEINTPIGICLTSISYYKENLEQLETAYYNKKLSRTDFENYIIKGKEIHDIMASNLTRAAELVKSFKRISADQSSEVYMAFSVVKRIQDTYLSIRPKYKNVDHSFTIHGDENLKIKGYPGIIAQIYTNFIMNSFKHGLVPEQKLAIDIWVRVEEGLLELVYRDNGKGIPEEIKAKIFEPFFTTARGSGGTGLGLNIVYNLVRGQLAGSVECESIQGEYTQFTIDIPLDEKDLA